MSATIDLWFDPSCPFAWMTSRWAREVAALRPVAIRWRLMSLAIVNEGETLSDRHRAALERSTRALRVLAATDRDHGNDALGRLYATIGERVHPGGRDLDDAVLAEALAEAGLPAALASAADDVALDDLVRRSHDEGQEAVGTRIGTPLVRIGQRAFFGPVVNPTPRGEDAARLYDAIAALDAVPGFSELKRGRGPELDLT